METVRRDLHTTTANVSSLLTRYSKLAQSASSSYSASGVLKDDMTRRKQEIETEINGALDTVSSQHHVVRQTRSLAQLNDGRPPARPQFEAQIDRLANFHATAQPPPSSSATHALDRHRDVLQEYRRDYGRLKVCLYWRARTAAASSVVENVDLIPRRRYTGQPEGCRAASEPVGLGQRRNQVAAASNLFCVTT